MTPTENVKNKNTRTSVNKNKDKKVTNDEKVFLTTKPQLKEAMSARKSRIK